MKKILLFSVVALMGVTLQAQFITQNSNTTESLYEVQFLNKNVGYVVGGNGTILKTVNGGNTWQNLGNSNTAIKLRNLYFLNENLGYVSGWEFNEESRVTEKVFLKTENAGDTWVKLEALKDIVIHDMFFTTKTTGFVAVDSEDNGLLRTSDGGVTWETVDFKSNSFTFNVVFSDLNTGYATYGSKINKTVDGGYTWKEVLDTYSTDMGSFITTLSVVKEDVFFMGSNYYSGFYSSVDGGGSFKIVKNDIVANELTFVNENIGYVINSYSDDTDYDATIFRTLNAGKDWKLIHEGKLSVNDLYFIDINNGWFVGKNGTILYYNPTLGNDKELLLESEVTIHPNPSFSEINIKVSKNINVLKMSLYDISGRLVFEKETATMISLKNFNSGNYFLKIQTDKGVINKKIIKK